LVVAGFWRNFRSNAFLTALVFSLAHAPNLPLMALVLVAETVWLLLFARFRNLLSFALAHALAALVVSHALVPDWLPSLRVGLHYLEL
ncbi:MAG: CPBP family glutamic-type intramembrane protease, partial [Vicinamibacteria bacterium]